MKKLISLFGLLSILLLPLGCNDNRQEQQDNSDKERSNSVEGDGRLYPNREFGGPAGNR